MDLKNYWDLEKLKENKEKIKNVFFYRICGTGMGAFATILKEKGLHVEGGDHLFFPPVSTYLKKSEIPCYELKNSSEKDLQKFDLIIVGNVVSKTGEDARFIESLGVPFCSFPSALGALILSEENVVGIAGTHGKTTTTYLMMQLFENLGIRPGYFIGGVLEDRPSASMGDGKYFFIESDEYDSSYFEKISKFRMYLINHLILTSLEFDHADIFSDIEDIKKEFKAILPDVKGHVIFDESYQDSKDLLKNVKESRLMSYSNTTVGPLDLKMNEKMSTFSLNFKGKNLVFETNLVGLHNIKNLSAVILFALMEGFSYEEIRKNILSLKMVQRRQEFKGLFKGAVVIDDFAHHPRAMTLTIDSIKIRYPDKKIYAIFGPHSATMRSSLFFNDLTSSFDKVDKLAVLKLQVHTSVKGKENLDIDSLCSVVESRGVSSTIISDLNQLRSFLEQEACSDALFLFLTNGNCLGLWESSFVDELQ